MGLARRPMVAGAPPAPTYGGAIVVGHLRREIQARRRGQGDAHTGLGMSTKTWRTPKRSLRCSPRRLTPNVSVA